MGNFVDFLTLPAYSAAFYNGSAGLFSFCFVVAYVLKRTDILCHKMCYAN